jgi:hypothetical protein
MSATERHKLVFGADVAFCPLTGLPYESGIGSMSREAQTRQFIKLIAEPEWRAAYERDNGPLPQIAAKDVTTAKKEIAQ